MQTGSVFNCDRADIDAGSVPGECRITPGKAPTIDAGHTAAVRGRTTAPGAMDRIGLADRSGVMEEPSFLEAALQGCSSVQCGSADRYPLAAVRSAAEPVDLTPVAMSWETSRGWEPSAVG